MSLIVVGIDPGVSGFAAEIEEMASTAICGKCDRGRIDLGRGELGDGERDYTSCTACDGRGNIPGPQAKSVRAIPIPVLPLEGARRTYDRTEIVRLVNDWSRMGVALVVIEQQQVFPKMGSFAGYLKGYGYGILTTALAMAGIPVEELRPSQWKKELGIALGGSSAMIKARSVEKAGALFPNVELRDLESKPGARVASHDKCEAMLLAEMAYRLVKRGART